jgi:hypothetical protein
MISLVAPFLAFLRLWAFGLPVRGGQEISPYVSRDGRYFFFMSARALERGRVPEKLTWDYLSSYRMLPEFGNPGIYWVDASFIEALRPEGF